MSTSPAAEPCRAALFDLDGTLLDSLADLADSMNAVLERAGLPTHPRASYRDFVGEGVQMLVHRALPAEVRADPHEIGRFVAQMLDEYRGRWDRQSRPYPGVAELLDALVARGLTLAILSNKPDEFTSKIARSILGRWHFAEVRGARTGIPRKPDPSAALDIARTLALPPPAFAYLGDTAIDMRTASAAGMLAVGVLWGFRGEQELREGGAQLLITYPLQLLPALTDAF